MFARLKRALPSTHMAAPMVVDANVLLTLPDANG
jgi:hypothetical protein